MVVGFSESSPLQATILDAASVMFALAVAVPVAQMTWETRALQTGGRAARILYTLAGLFVAAGAVMYIIAFATGQRGLATTAATLTFAGLGFAFVYLSWKALQREPPLRRAAFRMVPDDAEDDDVDSPDDFDADENLAKDDLTEEDDSPRRGM